MNTDSTNNNSYEQTPLETNPNAAKVGTGDKHEETLIEKLEDMLPDSKELNTDFPLSGGEQEKDL